MTRAEEINKRIEEIDKEKKELKAELIKRKKFSLMYINKSGKHTFVLQPITQMSNLKSSGWKEISKESLNTFLNDYDF